MGVSRKTLLKIIPAVLKMKPRPSILLRGPTAIGKSSFVYDLLQEIQRLRAEGDVDLPGVTGLVERRPSQMTEGDLLGIPRTSAEDFTYFVPMEWLREGCDYPRIMFFDELDRAINEVKQGLFELSGSHKLFGNRLHEDSFIIAAVNSGTYAGANEYNVNPMDPAELDRWIVFDCDFTAEDWLLWARTTGIHLYIRDFVKENKDMLDHPLETSPGEVYPSRRSWHRLDAALKGTDYLATSSSFLYDLAAAFIGRRAANAFVVYAEERRQGSHVLVEDIVIRGEHEQMQGWTVPEFSVFIDRCQGSDYLDAKNWDMNVVNNLVKILEYLPDEILMHFWSLLMNAAMDGPTKDGEPWMDYINKQGLKNTTVEKYTHTILEARWDYTLAKDFPDPVGVGLP